MTERDSCALPGVAPAWPGTKPAVRRDASTPAANGTHAERTWTGPGARARLALLQRTRSVAMVGASSNPARASFFVATYLLASSTYDVYFVNPRASDILGHRVYPSLSALPVVPDLVDVFRRHDDLPAVLDDTLAVGAQALWLQLGSWHEEVARRGEMKGLTVVMDRCLKIEHARFHGGLHLAGFDTGVISSRRAL